MFEKKKYIKINRKNSLFPNDININRYKNEKAKLLKKVPKLFHEI